MTVIELRFPAGGKLHATPWGRHVNEGATEWPLSPWRFQRALVATWYLKARDVIEEKTLKALMDSLAVTLPSFELPAAVQSHTRHYMPGRGTDKPKVFDTFVQSNQPMRIAWDVQLDEAQRQALGLLCERLGYLGRAESIVEAVLLAEGANINANSSPLKDDSEVPEDCELVRVLCPNTPDAHTLWVAANKPREEPKAGAKKKKVKSGDSDLPVSIFEALHAETGVLQSQGWMIPPGARWADYTRKIKAFGAEAARPKRDNVNRMTVARFAIASTVLPRITQAVSVAERLHQTLAKRSDGKSCAALLVGKQSDSKMATSHQHTHIFCELSEKRDAIGYITLYAPAGFDNEAQHVIEEVQRKPLWGHGGHDLELVLLGFGDTGTFDSPIFAKAKRWTSLTPFVSTRFGKTFRDGRPKIDATNGWQIGSASHDLLRLLSLSPGMEGAKIKLEDRITLPNRKTLRCLQYQTQRREGAGSRGNGYGDAFTIEFPEPVAGPLAFGYASHFGLGLFVPVEEK